MTVNIDHIYEALRPLPRDQQHLWAVAVGNRERVETIGVVILELLQRKGRRYNEQELDQAAIADYKTLGRACLMQALKHRQEDRDLCKTDGDFDSASICQWQIVLMRRALKQLENVS